MSHMKLNVGLKNWKRGGNILELDVPPELEVNVKSGIDWVDDAMGGEGFTPSQAVLLTGTPGAGKTTLSLALADAITGSGNIALFNTGEESLLQVRKVAKRLNLRHGFIAGQDTKLKDVLDHARELKKAAPKKQLFLICDSLQTLDDGFYKGGHTNSATPLRVTQVITDFCKETWAIGIIIGQVTKDGNFAGKMAILHAVDTRAHIFIDDREKSDTYGKRLFEVSKNRFGCSGKTHILEMGARGQGLVELGHFVKGG